MTIERDGKGRFERGKSPNPGSRSRTELEFLHSAIRRKPAAEQLVTNALIKKLEEKVPGDAKNRSYAECIAEGLIRRAIQGDVVAAREITLRVEGPLVPEQEHPSGQTPQPDDVYSRLARLIDKVRREKPSPSLHDPATKQ